MNSHSSPLFSIIIPIYNVEAYLKEAIDSVLAQQFEQYEIILVNDGSTDNCLQICLEYAQKHSHISVLNQANRGLSDARNQGIALARGEYLIFLDSDDYWQGQYVLHDIANVVKNEKVDLIINAFCCFEHNTSTSMAHIYLSDNLTGDFAQDLYLLVTRKIYRSNVWTKVIKRTLITENKLYFPQGFYHEDSDWSFNVARKIKSYKIYNSPFYCYRVRGGSITTILRKKNVTDLLTLIERNLYQLDNIRTTQPNLYQGLFNYLAVEVVAVAQLFDLLSDENKSSVAPSLERCEMLLNIFKKDFSFQAV